MPKWLTLPSEPLKFHPYQDAVWRDKRQRICEDCEIEYDCPPHLVCPQCQKKGVRKFHRFALISGRRGGKTKAGSIAVFEELMVPNTIIWACAPTNPKLHRYVIPAFQEIIPDNIVKSWNSEFSDLRLKNGSLLHFQTLEDPDQGRGQGLDGVWIDEASELTAEHWHTLRPSLTERRGFAIITTSPRGEDWVYKLFYKRAEEGFPGYRAYRYSTLEAPHISKEEVEEARATMPDKMFRQEYEADFVTFEESVYGDDIKEYHILRSDRAVKELIPEWPNLSPDRQVIVGIDTGADHPFGAVKLVSTEKGFVVIGEYLDGAKPFAEHCKVLKEMAHHGNVRWAINKNDKQGAIELSQHDIWCQSAENDVVAGTERVRSWLYTNQLHFVADRCPLTIQQMRMYRWVKAEANDGSLRKSKAYKRDDELPDAIRYALMSWPLLPKPILDAAKSRDISHFTAEQQFNIERLRKMEAKLKDDPKPVVEDFWGSPLGDF